MVKVRVSRTICFGDMSMRQQFQLDATLPWNLHVMLMLSSKVMPYLLRLASPLMNSSIVPTYKYILR